MKELLKNRNFLLLWTGQIVEQFGDSLNLMALIAWVMTLAIGEHSTSFNMSILMFWMGAPIIFLGPFAGVIVDRIKRKHILLFSAISRGIFVFFIYLIINNKELGFLVFILVFFISIVTQFFIPAKSSFIPQIVEEKQLLKANSLSATTTVIVQIFSYAIGGIIISIIGIKATLFINVCTYAISATTLYFINIKEKIVTKIKITIKDGFNEFIDGIKFLLNDKKIKFMIRRVFVLTLVAGFFYVAFTAKFLHVIIENTNIKIKDITGLGFMQAFLGIGLVLGIVLIEKILKEIKDITLIRILYPLTGILIIILYFYRNFYYMLFMSIIAGISGVMILSLAETILQKNTPDNIRGRIFASYYVLRNSGTVIASSLTGIIANIIDENEIILLAGIGLVFYGFINFINTMTGKNL